jgi:phenylacetate-coenzyme A ligase PaaK-like adenylate-forming protein
MNVVRMTVKLRDQLRRRVTVTDSDDGVEVADEETGFGVAFDRESAALLQSHRGSPELCADLAAMGLLEEGLPMPQVRARQRAFLVAESTVSVERLRAVLDHAVTQLPYYRERRELYAPEQLTSVDDIGRFPLLSKGAARRYFISGLIADDVDLAAGLKSGKLVLASSSGSTDERLQSVIDTSVLAYPFGYQDMWQLERADADLRDATLTTPICSGVECHIDERSYEERKTGNKLLLPSHSDICSISTAQVTRIFEEVERFSPDLLFVDPFYLHWIVRRATEWGIRIPQVPVVISSFEYASRLHRRSIAEGLGARVYSYYGVTEGGLQIAVECHRGKLHVREDRVFVEIVGPNGRKAPGQLGSIAVTMLGTNVNPFIRYLPGDVGALEPLACDCEAAHWPCLTLAGRAKDMLFLDRVWVPTSTIDDVLSEVPELDFYACVQTAARELRVDVMGALGRTVSAVDISERLRSRFGLDRVDVRTVTRFDPLPSLKFRLTEPRALAPPEIL